MAIVTFPADLGGSGITISDDTSPTTGLAAGGHRDRFVPALQQAVAMALTAKERASEAKRESLAAQGAKEAAQYSETSARDSATQVHASVDAASRHSASSSTQSSVALGAAAAANAALLALGQAVSHGLGVFYVDDSGDLVTDYSSSSISNITINNNGEIVITY